MIQSCIISWLPNLWMPTQPLVSFATGQQASPKMIENFKNLKLRGRDALQEFLSRFTSSSNSTNEQSIKSYYDPIKRQKLITFKSTGTKVKTKIVKFNKHFIWRKLNFLYSNLHIDLYFKFNFYIISIPSLINFK